MLTPEIADFKLAEERWDSAVAARLGRMSVVAWLEQRHAPRSRFKPAMRGFRGFFLADPEDLSLLPLVEQFAESGPPGRGRIFRIPGGNDRLATAWRSGCEAAAARNRSSGASSSARRRAGHGRRSRRASRIRDRRADYFVCALPASTARERAVRARAARAAARRDRAPALRLRDAAAAAVRTAVLEEARDARSRSARDLPTGAVWDGNEQQRGPRGILSFLAGGARLERAAGHPARAKGRPASSGSIEWLGQAVGAAGVAHDRAGTTTRGRAAATRTSIPASIRCGAPGSRVPPAGSSSPASTRASSARAT